MNKVKQIQISEEGILKVTIDSKKEFDSYMLQELNKQRLALPCMQKKRSTTTFYYDVSGRISLRDYLALYEFESREACAFLILLFTALDELLSAFPVYSDLDSVFFDPLQSSFSFVILPIHERQLDLSWNDFLCAIIKEMRICDGEKFYGRCFYLSLQKMIVPKDLITSFLIWKKQQKGKEWMIRKISYMRTKKQRKEQNLQRIQKYLSNMRLLQHTAKEDSLSEVQQNTSSDTINLFPKACEAYLQDETGKNFPLSMMNVLGRGASCNIRLTHTAISHVHAQIIREEHGFELTDLGSSNQTKLNGQVLEAQQAYVLHHQDEIELASIKFTFYEETRSSEH